MNITKNDLKKILRTEVKGIVRSEVKGIVRSEVKGIIKTELDIRDEKFAIMLNKHFYTKHELDGKFSNIDKKFSTLETSFSDKLRANGVLLEEINAKFNATSEGHTNLTKRINDHETRINKLELKP